MLLVTPELFEEHLTLFLVGAGDWFGPPCYTFINNFLFTGTFFVKFSDFSLNLLRENIFERKCCHCTCQCYVGNLSAGGMTKIFVAPVASYCILLERKFLCDFKSVIYFDVTWPILLSMTIISAKYWLKIIGTFFSQKHTHVIHC